MSISWRYATTEDSKLLAQWNHELISDEGHCNPMTVPELRQRMKSWLEGEYQAVLYSASSSTVGYALFRRDPNSIYLRQFFICRDQRRRGYGRDCFKVLQDEIWPKHLRLTVDVLCGNISALAFWREVGFADYSLSLEIMPKEKNRLI